MSPESTLNVLDTSLQRLALRNRKIKRAPLHTTHWVSASVSVSMKKKMFILRKLNQNRRFAARIYNLHSARMDRAVRKVVRKLLVCFPAARVVALTIGAESCKPATWKKMSWPFPKLASFSAADRNTTEHPAFRTQLNSCSLKTTKILKKKRKKI